MQFAARLKLIKCGYIQIFEAHAALKCHRHVDGAALCVARTSPQPVNTIKNPPIYSRLLTLMSLGGCLQQPRRSCRCPCCCWCCRHCCCCCCCCLGLRLSSAELASCCSLMPLDVSGIFLLILLAFDFIKQNYTTCALLLDNLIGREQRVACLLCLVVPAWLRVCVGVCVCVCLLGGLFDDVKIGQYRWRCAYRYYPAIRGRLVAAWLLM